MKPERQRIAIAEACGWEKHIGGWYAPLGQEQGVFKLPPNYPFDLNAMHEAEKWLLKHSQEQPTDALWKEYRLRLEGICGVCLVFHATATERAEAFLRAIGKWEED